MGGSYRSQSGYPKSGQHPTESAKSSSSDQFQSMFQPSVQGNQILKHVCCNIVDDTVMTFLVLLNSLESAYFLQISSVSIHYLP